MQMKKTSGTKAELAERMAGLERKIKKLETSESRRRQAESRTRDALAALRESEERFRTLYENAALGIYRTTPQGRVILANPALVRMLGYSSFAELATRDLGKNGFEPSYPRSRFTEKIERDGRITGLESAWKRKDGSTIWVRENATAIRDARGKVLYYDGTVEDVSERKQAGAQREAAQAALRESEERQQLILTTLPIAIFTSPLDPGVDTAWISGDVEKVTGYTSEQYMAEKDFWRSRLHPEDRERVLAAYRDPAAGDEIELEYRWLCRDGNYKWFHDRTIKKHTRQGALYFGIILDISERKQAEEENRLLQERLQWSKKMEAIGTLAGGIAHDFNNLLSGIQGSVSLALADLGPDHAAARRLKQIEEQVQSGVALTSQLLGFARGGRYEVKPSDINEIVERTSVMFARTRKEIVMHVKPGQGLWTVDVDRGQMEQVFLNLYVNAWQAMPGGGDIFLETENVLLQREKTLPFSVPAGKYVKITVSDNGSGMDEKTRARVFDPFFTTKEMGRGTGLGLASVYGIIKGHRGMINVYSEPGHGTTFTLYLPASDRAVEKDAPLAQEVVRGSETILLVEDEPVVKDVNHELLESLGYTVHSVGSGREAIELYAAQRGAIDLVILDMVMPGISGSETFDRLRAIDPQVKVLLSSGYSLNGEAQHIMDRGCNGFLQKPFQVDRLSQKVRETLDK
jgi:PAS domain S-box-containing protein